LVPVGLLLAGVGVAVSTLMPTYALIALCIGLSGVGVAAFHPEAARFANRAAGARRATGMSFFSLGGNLGFAVGPLVTTSLLLAFGLRGGLFLALPVAAMALLIAWQLPRFTARPLFSPNKTGGRITHSDDAWGPFLRLTGAVVSRSIVFFGLNTFIPLYWQDVLHQPVGAGGLALTVLFTAGAAGTLMGGWLSDRYGRRLVVVAAMVVLAVGLVAFVLARDVALATVLLVPLGLALNAPSSVMVVMGQEYLPSRVGTASGVTLGLAVSVGGLAAPLLGHVADGYGIHSVLVLLISLPVLAVGFAATLPKGSPRA
jgi:FSR family fosmidomycin resistance protein-like MFS transporter